MSEFAVVFCTNRAMLLPALAVIGQTYAVDAPDSYDRILFVDAGELPEGFDAWREANLPALDVREVDFREAMGGRLAAMAPKAAASAIRLRLDEMLPSQYRRFLYMDSDTEVMAPLSGVFGLDLGGSPVGGIDDIKYTPFGPAHRLFHTTAPAHRRMIGLGPADRYLNAGVLLVDRPEWRRQTVGPRAIAFLADNLERCPLAEQDALNVVLGGQYPVLSLRWNCMPGFFGRHYGMRLLNPAILHYAGPSKPWKPAIWRGDPAATERFRTAIRKTPWADGLPLDGGFQPTLKTRLRDLETPFRQLRSAMFRRPAFRSYLGDTTFIDVVQGLEPPAWSDVAAGGY